MGVTRMTLVRSALKRGRVRFRAPVQALNAMTAP